MGKRRRKDTRRLADVHTAGMTGQRGPGSPGEDVTSQNGLGGTDARSASSTALGGPAARAAGVYPSGMKGVSSEQTAGRCEGPGWGGRVSCLRMVAVPSSDGRQTGGHGGARSPAGLCARTAGTCGGCTRSVYVAGCVRLVVTDASLLSSLGGTRRDLDAVLGAEGEVLRTRYG